MNYKEHHNAMNVVRMYLADSKIKRGKCVVHQHCGVINPKVLNISSKTLATIKG